MHRLVIVHQGALGDFLLALPVFDGLHLLYPRTVIDFCSRLEHLSVLSTKAYFGEAHSFDGSALTTLYHDERWQSVQMPTYFVEARSVFLFGQSTSKILFERLRRLVDGSVYWLQSFPFPGHHEPVTQFLVAQLREQGLEIAPVMANIEIAAAEKLAVRNWMKSMGWAGAPKPIIIHPGSGGRKKIWPLSEWWALLKWIRSECDRPLLMVLGQADQHLKPFAAAAQRLGAYLLENPPLQRLAAFLSESALYIGNDSGVSHLAAATGIPTVAIFGPTLPEVWAPQGAEVHIIKSEWNELENLRWPPDEGLAASADVRHVVDKILN